MSDVVASSPVVSRVPQRAAKLPWSARAPQLLILGLTLVVGFFVLYPIVMLLIGSFAPARSSTDTWISLDGYRIALTNEEARRAMLTTLWLSLVRAGLAVIAALALAWAITRTNLPGRQVFHYLMLISFFLPLLPQILSWTLLLSPRTGTINVWLRSVLGLGTNTGPFDIFSYGGLIFLGVLGWSGFLYLFLSPAFGSIDTALEEAARMAGATSFRTLLRISVPILLPAVLGAFGLAFVRMVESFETELLVGTPAHIYVFTTLIYDYVSISTPPNYPPAIALSTMLIVLTVIVIAVQNWLLGNRSYVTIGGKGHRRTPADLGRWKWLVFLVMLLFNIIHLALPFGMLLLGSFQRSVVQLRLEGFTLDRWRFILSTDIWSTTGNTLLIGAVASTVGMLLVCLISYIVTRTKTPFRRVLDGLTWVPYMVPSFVLSLGFLWAVLKGIPWPFPLYGSLAVLMIAFIVRLMPLGSRLMNGTMVQLSMELEEAARMAGATWVRTFRRIVLPLLAPSLAIGWLMFMVTVTRDLSTVILLYGPTSKTLAVSFFGHWKAGTLEDAAVVGVIMTLFGVGLAMGIFALQRVGRGSEQQLL